MVRRLLLVLLLLPLAAASIHAEPTVASYSFTPNLAVYGPDVQVEVRLQMAGGQSQAYKLVLASEMVFRDWDLVVDLLHQRGSGGDLAAPLEIEVPAQAATVKISLNGSTSNLGVQQPKVLFRAEWKDSAGTLRELKTERRQVGPASVAVTPTPSPTPAPTPTPSPSAAPTPAPNRSGVLKVVVEPPGLAASIFVDGKFGGNGSYEATGLTLGQFLVTFGDVAGYEKPASQAVTLNESSPSVLLRGQYRTLAVASTPSPSPTPEPATPSPTPPPAGPGIPMAAVGGAVAVLAAAGAAVVVMRKRKAGRPPAPDAPLPEAPPPEPVAAPGEAESMPEEIPLDALQQKKEKIESKNAKLEGRKEKGEVDAEEYEEKKKRYARELEELDKEIAKRSG